MYHRSPHNGKSNDLDWILLSVSRCARMGMRFAALFSEYSESSRFDRFSVEIIIVQCFGFDNNVAMTNIISLLSFGRISLSIFVFFCFGIAMANVCWPLHRIYRKNASRIR